MSGNTRRLLVLDDDDDTLRMLCVALGAVPGLEVTPAHSATEMIEIFGGALREGRPFDGILADCAMRNMTGPTGVRHCRRLEKDHSAPHFKVRFMSAHPDVTNQNCELIALGADKVYAKPIDPVELIEEIPSWLGLVATPAEKRAMAEAERGNDDGEAGERGLESDADSGSGTLRNAIKDAVKEAVTESVAAGRAGVTEVIKEAVKDAVKEGVEQERI